MRSREADNDNDDDDDKNKQSGKKRIVVVDGSHHNYHYVASVQYRQLLEAALPLLLRNFSYY